MKNLINLKDLNPIDKFDYSQLDEETATFLKDIAIELSAINSKLKFIVGEKLYEAQQKLAKNGYGCFTQWIESYGLSKSKVYDWIKFYKVIVQNRTIGKIKRATR